MNQRVGPGWLVMGVLLATLVSGCLNQSMTAQVSLEASPDLPGLYQVVTVGDLSLMVADLHRYQIDADSWFLTVGMVLQSQKACKLSPGDFALADDRGAVHTPSEGKIRLKNPLPSGDLVAGETVPASLVFELPADADPLLLMFKKAQIVRLDGEVRPQGYLYSPEKPVSGQGCSVEITGISRAEEGDQKMIKVDYQMKNSGAGVMSLADRARGRFAEIMDVQGISYEAYDYKLLDQAIPPGGTVEGNMIYTLPAKAQPGYLVFWPPSEDALIFDLRSQFQATGISAISGNITS